MNTASPTLYARAATLLAVAAAATIAVACAASAEPGWTYMPLPPTSPPASASGSPGASGSPAASATAAASGSPAASGSAGASGSPAGNVIQLEETSSLQILQNGQPVTSIPVVAGQTYTFEITNSAGFDHDFYLGPPDKLTANTTDGLPGVPVFQTGTQTFTWTADASSTGWQFGCTVPGHFQNMHGDLSLGQ